MRRSKPRFSRVPQQASTRTDAGVPVCPRRWVKNCAPTGVAVEQTSNIARGTPGNPAESRFTFTLLQDREVLEHAGPVRFGGQRDPAFRAPFVIQGTGKMATTPPRRKEQGCISASTRVFMPECACLHKATER